MDGVKHGNKTGWWSTEMFAPQFAERDPRLTARLLQETTRLMVESAVPFGTRPKVVS